MTFLAAALVAGCAQPQGDFNGDGLTDLAISMPLRDAGIVKDAGAVQVLYGDPQSGRLGNAKTQFVQRRAPGEEADPAGLEETAREKERYGFSLASADFNADGYADMAVGVPFENTIGIRDSGAVNVLYGNELGLSTNGETWFQDKQGIEGKAEPNDLFGFALATGNFNGDFYEDLAIGVPLKDVSGLRDAGAVNVIYGGVTGLSEVNNQIWDQVKLGLEIPPIDFRFGTALAVGDFDGDGVSDLAIGAPKENLGQQRNVGAVNVIYGTSSGLRGDGFQIWRQADPFVMGGDMDNTGDRFGSALTAADFNADGYDDLAIGTPLDDWGDRENSGTVNVIYGSPDEGLDAGRDIIWHQNVRGTKLKNGDSNNYGSALAGGDFNDDGYADLAIGIPGYPLVGVPRAGAVHVIYGSPEGLSVQMGSQLWHTADPSMGGNVEANGEFGASLTTGDLNNDGIDDLVIGARGDPLAGAAKAGAVHVLSGSPRGLIASSYELWTEHRANVPGGAQTGDRFGAGLSAANGETLATEAASE